MTPHTARVVSAAGERMGTVTLTEFLLARIAEDEAVAGGPFDFESDSPQPHSLVCGYRAAELTIEEPECICGWPVRVLAQCEALREVVELHPRVAYTDNFGRHVDLDLCEQCGDGACGDRADWPCPTLRALAAVYADHPDYREEWRP